MLIRKDTATLTPEIWLGSVELVNTFHLKVEVLEPSKLASGIISCGGALIDDGVLASAYRNWLPDEDKGAYGQ